MCISYFPPFFLCFSSFLRRNLRFGHNRRPLKASTRDTDFDVQVEPVFSRMNIGSKTKKRVVLPSRPEPPTVDQILEDISKAAPDDPAFSILDKTGDSSRPADSEVELRFQQCRRYLELNEHLTEAEARLQQQREELQVAGEQLDRRVEEVQGQVL
ncbi:UPF0449 protein C19orf25 homolog [Cololabis saira]|uniref:UPF0449 protein C19orf25 homolog n=1 Tax=Cololabis saira TaxID=129043 RepID=UPI002AD565AD|nr:UPF0449 protein C19orf25 homolog [Cololabis saira]